MLIRMRKIFRKKPFPKEEIELLSDLEKRLKYCFKNLFLLKQALSHKSYINENRFDTLEHYERLEFLGDAVLELGISDLLMLHFPTSREGDMSKLRASIVNETALSEVARTLDLGRYIFLGKGEEQCEGREKNSLLADALEAVLGAVYQDSDFNTIFKIIKRLFMPVIELATKEDINRDYKTKLQEEVQNLYKVAPQYRLVKEEGPDHDKTFEVHLFISGKKAGQGQGKSKKQAEQNAAQDSLEHLAEFTV
ncbi:MAG: ribonuclease III [Deltaproteobacteria bacterium]|nr:ribonuclease III [Deltaproteobacteria bacterium]